MNVELLANPGRCLRSAVAIACAILISNATAISAQTPGPSDRPTSPLTVRLSIFDLLDLQRPELTRVRVLVQQQDVAGACTALRDHFRTRPASLGFWPQDARSIQNPDDLVNHIFSFYGSQKFDAGHPIRWNDTFLGDHELTYALNRHQHLTVLAQAWRQKHDPKYARAFVEQMRDWIVHNGSAEYSASTGWRDLEVATRLGVWCDVFFQFLSSPDFTPGDQVLMLQSLHEQAEWLAPQVAPSDGDWSATDAAGLAAAAVYFPEFKKSAQWQKQAYNALVGDFARQTYPDGSHISLSPYHQNAVVSTFWLPFKLAFEHRIAIPEEYRRNLECMCAYQAYIRRPDGRYPPFNACEPGDCRQLLTAAAKFFNRPDFYYIVTNGRAGTQPTSVSCAFRDSGVFVMRDGWTSQSNYLAIDAGPYGVSYQHEDKFGVEIAAFGRTVLVDPGRYTLDPADPLTNYLAGTSAHNTLTVDDSGQRRAQVPSSWRPAGNSPNCWISEPNFDYFAGSYREGFEAALNAVHERRVLFVKAPPRPYWIISDRVTESPPAHAQRKLTSRWQFASGPIEPLGVGPLTYTTKAARANIAICPPVDVAAQWKARVIEGSRNPFGGWVSRDYGKIDPAPQLAYDFPTSLPATMEYALVPFEGPSLTVGLLRSKNVVMPAQSKPEGASNVTALEINIDQMRDVVFIDHDLKSTSREVNGCKTKGSIVVVRQLKEDKPTVLIDK